MKKAKLLSPIALAAVLVAGLVAGCGGGSSASLQSEDVAVVGSTHVTAPERQALGDLVEVVVSVLVPTPM
jgi:hypothetical protein